MTETSDYERGFAEGYRRGLRDGQSVGHGKSLVELAREADNLADYLVQKEAEKRRRFMRVRA